MVHQSIPVLSSKVHFWPSNYPLCPVLTMQLQNQTSVAIQFSKPFTFDHPGGFGCGFADVAATCRWDPPVIFFSPISLSDARGADGEARALGREQPPTRCWRRCARALGRVAVPGLVLVRRRRRTPAQGCGSGGRGAARQAAGPRRPLPGSLGRWPARRGRGGRRGRAARPQRPFFPLLTANAIAGGWSDLGSRRPTATAPPDLN